MDEPEKEELLRRFDRNLSTDGRGRVRVRNPAGPYALLGVAVGALCAAGIRLTGRGGFITTGVLQIVTAAGVAGALLLVLLSLLVGRRVRRAAGVSLGLALAAFLALFVLGLAALALDLDLG